MTDIYISLLVYHKYLEIRPSLEYNTGHIHKIHSHAFYMLNHCIDESEFCLVSRLKSFEARTVSIPMGVSSDVDTRAM